MSVEGVSQNGGGESEEWIVFDLETTGLSPRCRIVEFACELTSNREVIGRYETIMHPGRMVGPTRIHGITDEMVAVAPRFEEVAGSIARLFVGRVPVAHNLRFDWSVLRTEFSRSGVDIPPEPRGICTATAPLGSLDRRVSLRRRCEQLGVPLVHPHRAAWDVRATRSVACRLASRGELRQVTRPLDAFSGMWRLPPSVAPYPRPGQSPREEDRV